jgi:hypothetical protein
VKPTGITVPQGEFPVLLFDISPLKERAIEVQHDFIGSSLKLGLDGNAMRDELVVRSANSTQVLARKKAKFSLMLLQDFFAILSQLESNVCQYVPKELSPPISP